MSKNVEISAKDWQKLVDLHEKLGPLLFEAVSVLQGVAWTATMSGMAADAARLFAELEPLVLRVFVEDPPFGIQEQK